MILALYDHPDGVQTESGNHVVYDLARDEAQFGAARVEGHALRWELIGSILIESGPEPVFAAASETEATAFVRVMLLPREWEGRRTIRYVDPADEDKPKLQRPTVFFDRPLVL